MVVTDGDAGESSGHAARKKIIGIRICQGRGVIMNNNEIDIEDILERLAAWDQCLHRGYYSSARNLDEMLDINWVKTDFRFARDYVYPGGKEPAEYERKISKYMICRNIFKGKQIYLKRPEYRKTSELLEENFYKLETEMKNDCVWLRQHNPELSQVEEDGMSLLCGACYQFAPENINWFIRVMASSANKSLLEKEADFHRFMDCENMMTGHRLCPQHQELLKDWIIKSRQAEDTMTVADKKAQMKASYAACIQSRHLKNYSPPEELDSILIYYGLIDKPMFAYQYRFPDGKDNEQLGNVLWQMAFYAEIQKKNCILMESRAPKWLLEGVRQSCIAEFPEKQKEWGELAEKIVMLNPELSGAVRKDLRGFLTHVYQKRTPDDIINWRTGNTAGNFIDLMRERGVRLNYLPGVENQKKLLKLTEQNQSMVMRAARLYENFR